MKVNWQKISIVMPTLNAEKVLGSALESIKVQDYPKDKIEIIVADGSSSDGTLDLAKKYGARVVGNKLRTGEAGKAAALREVNGEFVIFIDSDNILPTKNWIKQMIKPLIDNPNAVGSEPWKYTWRKEDGFITRYCALIGMNDPLVHFLGNYDRVNLLTGKWTEVPHEEEDMGDYLLVKLDERGIPTIGANGTVFRKAFLDKNWSGDYFFDIDIIHKKIRLDGSVLFIKVKNGIIHTFCENNVSKFIRKQKRRIKDYLYHQYVAKDREYDWSSMDISGKNNKGILLFIFSCLTVIPLIIQSLKGYFRKPDMAWFFHPIACEITLWEYGWAKITGIFKKAEISRSNWRQ
ncbi:glycosyltransferase [Patescibacteria group bacterium]|nr:glycosyltransferase [Patescibacteria group bacterium]